MKAVIKVTLSVVAFLIASGATYVAVNKWKAREHVDSGKGHQQDTLDGVSGLTEGEIVGLPTLTTLNGKTVSLGDLKEDRVLCVFIGSQCSGCTKDADLWRDLNAEAGKRGVGFYLIDVSDEFAEAERFSAAYSLHELPLLYDPNRKVGRQLKVGFLPQYLLFKSNGEVVHRWDGTRRYDKRAGSEQLAEFFQPHN